MSFEPKILGFLCNWCSYAGADLAGVSRIQYPPNIRVIRVMCSGRVDPEFIFEGLLTGLDGVIVMGCHPGDCHYLEGNYEAEKKFNMVKKFLELINFENRIRLEWVSASEGARFAEVVTNFTNQIRELGPTPINKSEPDEKLREKLQAMKMAVSNYRMRALVGRERDITENENAYGDKTPLEKFENIFNKAIRDEFYRHYILLKLNQSPKSVKDLAKEIEIDPSEVLDHLLILKGRGQVDMENIIGITPIYISLMEG